MTTFTSNKTGYKLSIFAPFVFFFVLALALLSSNTFSAFAQELDESNGLNFKFRGFVDSYHAVRANSNFDWMSSRTRARGEFNVSYGDLDMFLSMNAIYNGVLPKYSGFHLRESYLRYSKGLVDLTAGRQIIIWGNADALRISDQISPMDLSEFLAQDYDDIRIPVNAIRLKLAKELFCFDFVCIPISDFFIIPKGDNNPWSMRFKLAHPYKIDLENGKPEKKITNSEIGTRFSMYLSALDFSFSALYTWNKMPAITSALSADGSHIEIIGKYQRMGMIAGDCAIPLGSFVLRTEIAGFFDELQSATFNNQALGRHSVHSLLGVDWYPGNDWNISLQYSHKYIFGDMTNLSVQKNTNMTTIRLSKDFFRNSLKCSTFAYIDIDNLGVFNRLSLTYQLNDQMSLTGGYDLLHAKTDSDKGLFRAYNKNSEFWFKLKYSF